MANEKGEGRKGEFVEKQDISKLHFQNSGFYFHFDMFFFFFFFFSFKFQTDQRTYCEMDSLPVRLPEETQIIVLE